MVRSGTVEVSAQPSGPAPPGWKLIFNKEYPDAKTYKGKCTHEDCAFLVDPLKLTGDWEAWAKSDLPKDIEGQYAGKGAVPLRLKVYAGTEPVLFGLVQYPAVRVESWHHGSPAVILVIAAIIGLVIVIWAFLAWLFQKAEELDWVVPVGAGILVLLLLVAFAAAAREVKEIRKPAPAPAPVVRR